MSFFKKKRDFFIFPQASRQLIVIYGICLGGGGVGGMFKIQQA